MPLPIPAKDEQPDEPQAEATPDPQQIEQLRQSIAAARWIEQKWSPPRFCPICTSNEWIASGIVDLPVRSVYGLGKPSGTFFPVVQYLCNVCGHVLLFNAIKAGVIGQDGSIPDTSAEDLT